MKIKFFLFFSFLFCVFSQTYNQDYFIRYTYLNNKLANWGELSFVETIITTRAINIKDTFIALTSKDLWMINAENVNQLLYINLSDKLNVTINQETRIDVFHSAPILVIANKNLVTKCNLESNVCEKVSINLTSLNCVAFSFDGLNIYLGKKKKSLKKKNQSKKPKVRIVVLCL
jgi:hypothetical protein